MACEPQLGTAFLPWAHGKGPERESGKRATLKPTVARIGVKTRWAQSPAFIAANIRKFETKENRERELKELEIQILKERHEQQVKQLQLPIQLDTYSHLARTASQERLHAESIDLCKELSTITISIEERALVKKVPYDGSMNNVRYDGSMNDVRPVEELLNDSIGSLSSASSSESVSDQSYLYIGSVGHFNRWPKKLSYESTDEALGIAQSRQMSGQYLALMSAVSGKSRIKHPEKGVPIDPDKELYIGPLQDALKSLKSNLKDSKIMLPDEEVFGDCLNIATELPWMTIAIKEFINLPECLITSVTDVERSYSAALLRQAAWDHYFFKSKQPYGTFSAPFGGYEEGDNMTADRFLYPSRAVRNLSTHSCLWEQITESKVLELFMKFVIREKHMKIPPYLIQSGYMERIHQATIDSESDRNIASWKKKLDQAFDASVKIRKEEKAPVFPLPSSILSLKTAERYG